MRSLRAWFVRFGGLFNKRRSEQEIGDEIESNLQLHIDDGLRDGMNPQEARRQALIRLGGIEPAKEAWRDRARLVPLETAMADCRYAVRQLRRSPVFAVTAILTLTLCVGANTAVFSIADAVLFRPLPYDDPDGVQVLLMREAQTGTIFTLTPLEYLRVIDERHEGIREFGLIGSGPAIMFTDESGTERIGTVGVTANYFELLGVRAARGRLFHSGDVGQAGRIAVLTHASWRQRFGEDESIVGSAVPIGTETFDIVGVLPPDFIFTPRLPRSNVELVTVEDLWRDDTAPTGLGGGGNTWYPIVRLQPDTTPERAQAEMDALIQPLTGIGDTPPALPFMTDIRSQLYPTGRPIMALLLAASGLILLLGSANLANMLVARARQRELETGVRAALGAGRLRLVRPLLIETAIVGLISGILAIAATSSIFDALLAQVPQAAYGQAMVGVDFRVGFLALLAGLSGGLLTGILVAWRSQRNEADVLIRSGLPNARGRGPGRPMIAAQVGLSVVLVFGAVAASRTFLSVVNTELGFDPANVLVVSLFPPADDGLTQQAFYSQVLEAVATDPDVISVGATGSLPMDGTLPDVSVLPAGSTERTLVLGGIYALPGYWETARIPLVRGRLLDWNDVQDGTGNALVNESAAERLFRGSEPIGQVLETSDGRPHTVVGVVSDLRTFLNRPLEPLAYVIPPSTARRLTLIVRTRARQDRLQERIRREVGDLAAGTPVTARWWTDMIGNQRAYSTPRFQTIVLGSFGTLGLALTAVGIFAVVMFTVSSRKREFGIRLALGARPGALSAWMVREAMVPAGIGLAAGLAATIGLGRIAATGFLEILAPDLSLLILVFAIVTVTALAAAYLPARRAGQTDPLIALRHE